MNLLSNIQKWMDEQALIRDLEHTTFETLCQKLDEKGYPHVKSGKSRIYTFPPPASKVVLTPTEDGYEVEFISRK